MMVDTAFKPIEQIQAEAAALRARRKKKAPKGSRQWYGIVFLQDDGNCSMLDCVDGKTKPVILGRSVEIIPMLRDQGIDGEDFAQVLQACRNFHQGGKNSPHNLPGAHQGNGGGTSKRQARVKTPKGSAPIVTTRKNRLVATLEAQERGCIANGKAEAHG